MMIACLETFVVAAAAEAASWDYQTAASDVTTDLINGSSPDGYNVASGEYMFFFLEDCKTYNLATCFLLNGASPYGMTMMPPSPVEVLPYLGTVSPSLANPDGSVGDGCQTRCTEGNCTTYPEITPKICVDDKSMHWRLGYDEAIVLIGLSPPEALYWSFTWYVFTQYYEVARTQPLDEVPFGSYMQGAAVMCPDGPARCQTAASLGTPWNKHRLSQTVPGGTGTNQPFALVLTANRQVAKDVSAAVERQAGLKAYVGAIPSDLVTMGTSNDYQDTFTILQRIAYPQNSTQMEADYFTPKPIQTLRVTPKHATAQSSSTKLDHTKLFTATDTEWVDRDLYIMEEAPADGTPTPVLTSDQLNASLYRMASAIHAKHGGHVVDTALLKQWFVKGVECISTGCHTAVAQTPVTTPRPTSM